MEKEVWKSLDFLGYPNYMVSNMGRVKSLNYRRMGKEKILVGRKNKKGYLLVHFRNNGKDKGYTIHSLVAYAFKDNPNNLPQINHIDEDKSNNCVTNLEYCTCKENINWGTRIKRISKKVYQYDLDYNLVRIWESTAEAGRSGFNQGDIAKCCRSERKTHKGFIWRYTPIIKRYGFFGGALSLKKVG